MNNSISSININEKKILINKYLEKLPKSNLETIFKLSNLIKNNNNSEINNINHLISKIVKI